MPEETQAQALALGGTLYDTRDVGHDKRLAVSIAHNAQRGLHRGERIVGNLRAGVAQCADQRRLARIGEAHQTDVGQQLEFQDDGHLLHRLAGLCIAWCLVGSRAELEVAQSAAPALQEQHLLTVVGHVADILARLGIIDHGAAGHVDIHVLAVGAVAFVLAAVAAVLCKDMALVFQVQ